MSSSTNRFPSLTPEQARAMASAALRESRMRSMQQRQNLPLTNSHEQQQQEVQNLSMVQNQKGELMSPVVNTNASEEKRIVVETIGPVQKDEAVKEFEQAKVEFRNIARTEAIRLGLSNQDEIEKFVRTQLNAIFGLPEPIADGKNGSIDGLSTIQSGDDTSACPTLISNSSSMLINNQASQALLFDRTQCIKISDLEIIPAEARNRQKMMEDPPESKVFEGNLGIEPEASLAVKNSPNPSLPKPINDIQGDEIAMQASINLKCNDDNIITTGISDLEITPTEATNRQKIKEAPPESKVFDEDLGIEPEKCINDNKITIKKSDLEIIPTEATNQQKFMEAPPKSPNNQNYVSNDNCINIVENTILILNDNLLDATNNEAPKFQEDCCDMSSHVPEDSSPFNIENDVIMNNTELDLVSLGTKVLNFDGINTVNTEEYVIEKDVDNFHSVASKEIQVSFSIDESSLDSRTNQVVLSEDKHDAYEERYENKEEVFASSEDLVVENIQPIEHCESQAQISTIAVDQVIPKPSSNDPSAILHSNIQKRHMQDNDAEVISIDLNRSGNELASRDIEGEALSSRLGAQSNVDNIVALTDSSTNNLCSSHDVSVSKGSELVENEITPSRKSFTKTNVQKDSDVLNEEQEYNELSVEHESVSLDESYGTQGDKDTQQDDEDNKDNHWWDDDDEGVHEKPHAGERSIVDDDAGNDDVSNEGNCKGVRTTQPNKISGEKVNVPILGQFSTSFQKHATKKGCAGHVSFRHSCRERDDSVMYEPSDISKHVIMSNTLPENVSWLVPQQCVQDLICSIQSESRLQRSNACGTMKILSSKKNNQWSLARTSGLLDALIFAAKETFDLETNLSLDIRARVMATISNLSSFGKNRAMLYNHPGILPLLIATLKQDYQESRASACSALAYLVKADEIKLMFVGEEKVLTILSWILSGKHTGPYAVIECGDDDIVLIKKSEKATETFDKAQVQDDSSLNSLSNAEDATESNNISEEYSSQIDKDEESNSYNDEDEDSNSHKDRDDDSNSPKNEDDNSNLPKDKDTDKDEDPPKDEEEDGFTSKLTVATDLRSYTGKETLDKSLKLYTKKSKPFMLLTRVNACAVFSQLVRHPTIGEKLRLNQAFITALIGAIHENELTIHAKLLELFCYLTHFPSILQNLLEDDDLLNKIIEDVKSQKLKDRLWALRILQNVSCLGVGRRVLSETSLITYTLSSMTRCGQQHEQIAALGVIYNFAYSHETITKISSSINCISSLIVLSADKIDEIRVIACDTLAMIAYWLQEFGSESAIPDEIKQLGTMIPLPTKDLFSWNKFQ